MIRFYRLIGKLPVPCALEEAGWFPFSDRLVGMTSVGPLTVSTVFIVVAHGGPSDAPLLFETMIFGGDHDEVFARYATWDEAERGHARAVDHARQILTSANEFLKGEAG